MSVIVERQGGVYAVSNPATGEEILLNRREAVQVWTDLRDLCTRKGPDSKPRSTLDCICDPEKRLWECPVHGTRTIEGADHV